MFVFFFVGRYNKYISPVIVSWEPNVSKKIHFSSSSAPSSQIHGNVGYKTSATLRAIREWGKLSLNEKSHVSVRFDECNTCKAELFSSHLFSNRRKSKMPWFMTTKCKGRDILIPIQYLFLLPIFLPKYCICFSARM